MYQLLLSPLVARGSTAETEGGNDQGKIIPPKLDDEVSVGCHSLWLYEKFQGDTVTAEQVGMMVDTCAALNTISITLGLNLWMT